MLRSLIIALSLFVSACTDVVNLTDSTLSKQQIWGFFQINVPAEGELVDAYYYYGKVSQSVFNKIKQNEIISGFITLKSVKYWGNDNLIHDYADGERNGEIMFRIEDIRKVSFLNKAPVAGLGAEQFESSDQHPPEQELTEPDTPNKKKNTENSSTQGEVS